MNIHPPEGEKAFAKIGKELFEVRVFDGQAQTKYRGQWIAAESLVDYLDRDQLRELSLYGLKNATPEEIQEILKQAEQ